MTTLLLPALAASLLALGSTTHEFWKAIHTCALRAEQELGIDIQWKGPLKKNDRAQQIQVMQQFFNQGVDGIALAPLDYKALAFVGFDASPPLVEALREGQIHALVVQDPHNMGYLAVKTLVDHLRGQQVEASIPAALAVVTTDNMDDPAIKRLIE